MLHLNSISSFFSASEPNPDIHLVEFSTCGNSPFRGSPSMKSADAPRAGFLRARRVLSLADGVTGDAIWWQQGRVRAVGPAAALARQVPRGTPTVDLPAAIVTPGFVDVHTHFAMWALGRRRVQLAGAATRDDAVRRVAEAARVQGWIVGQGWDANGWAHVPDRAALDAVQRAPVYLDSLDVHA